MIENLIETEEGWKYTSYRLNDLMEEEMLTVESDAADSYYIKMVNPRMNAEFLVFPVEGVRYGLEHFMSIVELYKDTERVRKEVIMKQPLNIDFDLH